jgi:mannose-6-phosphate isomerase
MSDSRIYPLTFTPALRNYIWGGRRLETLYGRTLPSGIVAESWEISGHPAAATAADAGYWTGRPLPTILVELGLKLTGTRAGWALARGKFPLLVKLLDAHQNLSVQVHPDDAYALAHENGELGKAEMWYVLHAEPGAELILGLQPGTTREAFEAALRMANGGWQVAEPALSLPKGRRACPEPAEGSQVATCELEAFLRRVPVRAGQAIAIPTGTVHALLVGTVVTEIQQNSDATYRVYDWGRVGPDGQPRPLHVEKALEVINFGIPEEVPGTSESAWHLNRTQLVRNSYFVVEEVRIAPAAPYTGACDGSTLEIWGCVMGQVAVEWTGGAPVPLPAIRYVLLPAALGEFRITAGQPSTCLRVYLPES